MARSIRYSLSRFGSKLLESIRKNSSVSLDEAVFEERVIGIEMQPWLYMKPKLKMRKSFTYCKSIGIYTLAKLRDFCYKKDILKSNNLLVW